MVGGMVEGVGMVGGEGVGRKANMTETLGGGFGTSCST